MTDTTTHHATTDADNTTLAARNVTLAYDKAVIAENLSVEIEAGSFTAIVGPNACGKSTLLRAMARLLKPVEGTMILDGRAISDYPSKEVARRLGLLPQTSIAPDGIRVTDLVGRGRHPHQTLLRQWSRTDRDAVDAALEATGTQELASRLVDELSGGQRQRVWIAMLLAQESPIMLLDEPTTFLDISHQYDLLKLFRALRDEGRTVVTVLHDLNQAARFADRIVMMRDGHVVASGAPADIVTAESVESVFGLSCSVIPDPHFGTPMIVPY
ncbi:ABC transporter ATP-binding protein [Microbacterium allomyrinae]|uniref:ABC transporter ATP-binding protein n=1 Tax=Microbacterium allomyrinae TaxID=2830666 RepID=A0A9X1LSV8_9MICO|nr:ABC transporter ATP-binding protein [Microbacterium allomyrinae]MCC2030920.1 ABC transporter ATP-binding protein [Microbacterium allomyrinae]